MWESEVRGLQEGAMGSGTMESVPPTAAKQSCPT